MSLWYVNVILPTIFLIYIPIIYIYIYIHILTNRIVERIVDMPHASKALTEKLPVLSLLSQTIT